MPQPAPPASASRAASRIGAAVVMLCCASIVTVFVVKVPGAGDDFSSFYSGAVAISEGKSPYDATSRLEIQKRLVPRTTFLHPAYYPPWVYQICLPLVPFGYEPAKTIWVFVNSLALMASGLILGRGFTRAPYWPPLFATVFLPSLLALRLGQLDCLMLLGAAVVWDALRRSRGRIAGITIVLLLAKPHLGGILFLAVCFRAARDRHWTVLRSAAATLGVVMALGCLADLYWPYNMAQTIIHAPLARTTETVGVTLLCVLRGFGAPLWLRALLWCLAALICGGLLFKVLRIPRDGLAIHHSRWDGLAIRPTPDEGAFLVPAALLAVFFLSPYAMLYDYCLLVPALFLPLAPRWRMPYLLAFVVVPYVQAVALVQSSLFTPQSFFWIPCVLLAVMHLCARQACPTAR